MYTVAKSYRFSASHTLRSPYLSDTENISTYGKCANPSGHGHDYTVELRLSSAELTDDVVFGRGLLDSLVTVHLAPRFTFADVSQTLGEAFISSGENLAMAAHRLLVDHIPMGLALEVRVIETDKNSFVYKGE